MPKPPDTKIESAVSSTETRTLSPAATEEILGDDLSNDISYVIAFSKNKPPFVLIPEGKTYKKDFKLPYTIKNKDILKLDNISSVKTAAKCYVYINGVIYCVPC